METSMGVVGVQHYWGFNLSLSKQVVWSLFSPVLTHPDSALLRTLFSEQRIVLDFIVTRCSLNSWVNWIRWMVFPWTLLDLTVIKTSHFLFPLMRYHRYTLAAILARMKVERRANGQIILFKLRLWRLLGSFSFPALLLWIFWLFL